MATFICGKLSISAKKRIKIKYLKGKSLILKQGYKINFIDSVNTRSQATNYYRAEKNYHLGKKIAYILKILKNHSYLVVFFKKFTPAGGITPQEVQKTKVKGEHCEFSIDKFNSYIVRLTFLFDFNFLARVILGIKTKKSCVAKILKFRESDLCKKKKTDRHWEISFGTLYF